jgi:FdhE protein
MTDPGPRRRRGLPPRSASFDAIEPDPSRIGGVAEAPFVRLPNPATLFAHRAERLRGLAEGHTLAPYLEFLAAVVTAQAACVTALPPPAPVRPAQLAQRAEHGFPPLAADQLLGDAGFEATLGWLLDHVALDAAPEATRAAVAALRAMPAAERGALAADMLAGGYALDRLGESLFVAVAVQVHLARLASTLDAGAVMPAAEAVCPVCGAGPVASLVVGWTQASKARYCACSLCGTLWNHVRIKCTACGSTAGIAYYTIEDQPASVGVETCSVCRSYIKHLQQHEDPALDPVADDIASYALDLLAADQQFRRAGINPLFLTG